MVILRLKLIHIDGYNFKKTVLIFYGHHIRKPKNTFLLIQHIHTTVGINMHAYHIDIVDDELLDYYVIEENRCHGGNRSFQSKLSKQK